MTSKGNIEIGRRVALLLAAIMAALMLSSGVALAATITCQANVECFGTPKPDTLMGTAGQDDIFGRGNNDILRGRGEFDKLYGQGSSDRLFGGPGVDWLNGGPGNDALNGGGGHDSNHFLTNIWGKDSIADGTSDGGSLRFYLNGKGVTEDLTIKLLPGAGPEVKNASGSSTINWQSTTLIDDVYSGNGDDNITGNLVGNLIQGEQGTDTISTLAGDDEIYVVDGEKDYVNCGSNLIGGQDEDYVRHDSLDEVSDNCEEKLLITP